MGSSHFVQVAPQYKTNYCPRTVASIRVFFLFAVFAIQFYLDSFSCTSVACHHAQVFCFLPDLTSLSSNWCIVSCQDEVNIVFSPFCREVDRIMVLRLSTRRQCNQFARGKFHPILSPYNFLRATAPKCNTKLYVLCIHVQQTTKSTKKGETPSQWKVLNEHWNCRGLVQKQNHNLAVPSGCGEFVLGWNCTQITMAAAVAGRRGGSTSK